MGRSLQATQILQPFLQDLQGPDYELIGEMVPWGEGEEQEEEPPLKNNNRKQVHNNRGRLFLATELLHSCGLRFYLVGSRIGGEKADERMQKAMSVFLNQRKISSGMNCLHNSLIKVQMAT